MGEGGDTQLKNEHPLGIPSASQVAGHKDYLDTNASRVTYVDRWLAKRIMEAAGNPPIHVELWNGEPVYTPTGNSYGKMVFKNRSVLLRTLKGPELAFGDAYSDGELELHGDLYEIVYRCFSAIQARGASAFKKSVLGQAPKSKINTPDGSKKHIHHHYDLGNEFYRLWLDEKMVYTCAYYPQEQATLEQAQIAKMDHVCRKVRLEPGQTVIEAGCGWGSLALHMAKNYGVKVRAFNISEEQIAFAQERAVKEQLSGQVEFIKDDYRNVSGKFDAFVSIGMLEHVGLDHFDTLGEVIKRSLEPDGIGIIHSIGRNHVIPVNEWLEKRIFPGSYPPSIREMLPIFEERFSILDLENIRLHYAKTLLEWLARFDRNIDTIRSMYDEPFVRAWRLYLAGCAASFMSASLQLFQVVFTHTANNKLSLTREHLYSGAPAKIWQFD